VRYSGTKEGLRGRRKRKAYVADEDVNRPDETPPADGGQTPPSPGWWLASDGQWYPPESASTQQKSPQQRIEPYPEASQATTALVLGILGVVLCQVLAPFAWVMGQKEMQAIDGGRRSPENRGTANAAKILGIVGTVLLGIGIIAGILFLLFFTVAAVSTS
jgi:hypothetical protein